MLIVGAKGFAKQLVEIFFQLNNTEQLFFFDDTLENSENSLFDIKIIRDFQDVKSLFRNVSNEFCLGTGNPLLRKMLCERFEENGGMLCSVISPYAHISSFTGNIGSGTNILTGAVVENDACLGKGVLININAVIHHDVVVGNYCEISPGAKLLGNVHLGNNCTVGSNAVILPNIAIADDVIIGAGAVVTKNINIKKTVVGVPAKELKRNG